MKYNKRQYDIWNDMKNKHRRHDVALGGFVFFMIALVFFTIGWLIYSMVAQQKLEARALEFASSNASLMVNDVATMDNGSMYVLVEEPDGVYSVEVVCGEERCSFESRWPGDATFHLAVQQEMFRNQVD